MKNYSSEYFDLSVCEKGLIRFKLKSDEKFYARHERKFFLHFDLGCNVANRIAEPATDNWYEICLSVMDAFYEESAYIKNEVMSYMNYGYFHPKYKEEDEKQKGLSFNEGNTYFKGYTSAVNDIDKQLKYSLDKVFPENVH